MTHVEVFHHCLLERSGYDGSVIQHHHRTHRHQGMSVWEKVCDLLIPSFHIIRNTIFNCCMKQLVIIISETSSLQFLP